MSEETHSNKAEDSLTAAGDIIKTVAVNPTISAVQMSATNAIYNAGTDNASIDAVARAVEGTIGFVQTYNQWRKDVNKYNAEKTTWRSERNEDKLKATLEKKQLKTDVAYEKAFSQRIREDRGGLKFTSSEKRSMWKKVHPVSDNYLQKNVDKDASRKICKLEEKEWRQAKKVYKSRTIREAYVNDATGKVVYAKRKVLDTNRLKKPKPHKPNSLLVTNGFHTLRNEAYRRMQSSDDAASQALAKGLEFAQRQTFCGKLSTQSKTEKALKKKSLQLEKTSNRLQFEKANQESKAKKAQAKKQAQKKAARKRQQAQKFQKAQKAAKISNEVAKEVAQKLVFSKVKGVAICAALIIVLVFMLPMILGPVCASGGGSTIGEGVIATTIYPVQDDEVTSAWNSLITCMNGLHYRYVTYINDFKDDNGRFSEGILSVKKGGYNIHFENDFNMNKFAALLSVIHRGDWSGVNSTISKIVSSMYQINETWEEVYNSKKEFRGYKIKYKAERIKSFDSVASSMIAASDKPDENRKFYNSLNKSFGGHQQLGTPLSKSGLQKGWHDLAKPYGYTLASSVETEEDYYIRDNKLCIPCGSGRYVLAGASGRVTSKSSDCITITYNTGFTVDYFGSTSTSLLTTGAAVENGTELFKTSSSGLQLSVRKGGIYLNPYYLFYNDAKQQEKSETSS